MVTFEENCMNIKHFIINENGEKNKTGREGRDWVVWVDFSAEVTWGRGVNDKASATQKSGRRVWQTTGAAGAKSHRQREEPGWC